MVRRIKNWDQVEKIYLDLDSPNFRKACWNLGLEAKDCKKKGLKHFEEKGADPDVV